MHIRIKNANILARPSGPRPVARAAHLTSPMRLPTISATRHLGHRGRGTVDHYQAKKEIETERHRRKRRARLIGIVGETVREIGLLWMVFAPLDALFQNREHRTEHDRAVRRGEAMTAPYADPFTRGEVSWLTFGGFLFVVTGVVGEKHALRRQDAADEEADESLAGLGA